MIDMPTPEQAAPALTPRRTQLVVGVATPSQTVKKLWHSELEASRPSLKVFAKKLIKAGDKNAEVFKKWLDNKQGSNNSKQLDSTIKRITETKNATHLARKPKRPGV